MSDETQAAAPAAAETIPAEPETKAPEAETSTGAGSGAFPDFGGTTVTPGVADTHVDQVESEEAFHARLEAERAALRELREKTPVQCVNIRPQPGAERLGAVIATPDGVRTILLADWRTDVIALRVGDTLQIQVLEGDGQKTFEFYTDQAERQAKAAAAVPALGADQPTGTGLPNSSATADPATGP